MIRRSLIALSLMAAIPAGAQMSMVHEHARSSSTSASADALVARARAATEIFSDRNVAIAQGYRRVGRDMPSMGEHWISTRLVVDGGFDVTHPQILTYLKVGGNPILTGVVFAIPLAQGESPPDAFGPDAMWHEHNGTVDDEALIPQHHSVASAAEGTRVAFLHVWTRVQSPESIYSAENWALPFVRVGLPVPDKFTNGAARTVSLLNSGKTFYFDLIESHADSAAFDRCEQRAAEIVNLAKRDGRALTGRELQQLDSAWQLLLQQVAQHSGMAMVKRINGGEAL